MGNRGDFKLLFTPPNCFWEISRRLRLRTQRKLGPWVQMVRPLLVPQMPSALSQPFCLLTLQTPSSGRGR